MSGMYCNGVRMTAGAAGVWFSAERFIAAPASNVFFYNGWYYWLGTSALKTANCSGWYGVWTDGVYTMGAGFAGWYSCVASYTYTGDCDLRGIISLGYGAHLLNGVPAYSPVWVRCSVLSVADANAVGQHFFGMNSLGDTFSIPVGDVAVSGFWQFSYHWPQEGTVTFEIQPVYRSVYNPGGAGVGVMFSGVRFVV